MSLGQQVREEVVEDFVRNFLVRVGLHKTADTFQAEWYIFVQLHIILLISLFILLPHPFYSFTLSRYELQVTGKLPSHLSHTLSDIHAQ